MVSTGAVAGAALGLLAGPLLAQLVHRSPAPGPWWNPWSATDPAATTRRERVLVAALATAFGGLAGAAAGWGPAWSAFVLVGLAAAPLTVVDVRIHRLPDRIVLPTSALAAVALVAAASADGRAAALGRGLVAAVVVAVVLGLPALRWGGAFGLGDAKLAALLSLLLGWISAEAVVLGLFAGFALGAVVAVALLVSRRAALRSAVPAGPTLITGALLVAALLGG